MPWFVNTYCDLIILVMVAGFNKKYSKNLQGGNAFLFVIIAVIVLVLLGVLYVSISSPKNLNPNGSSSMTPTNKIDNSENRTSEDNLNGKYIEYTKEVYEVQKNGRHLLFFYANWCPTCIPVDKEIKTNTDKIPDGLTIVRVNYNDTETDAGEKQLASKYAVTYQHTFVEIDGDGNEVQKWNGGSLSEILEKL